MLKRVPTVRCPKVRHSSMRTSLSSAGVSWRTLIGYPSYACNRACALLYPSPIYYVMAKIVPMMQLAPHAKSSILYGRSYGLNSKFFRLDGLLLFRIIMSYAARAASSATSVWHRRTLGSWFGRSAIHCLIQWRKSISTGHHRFLHRSLHGLNLSNPKKVWMSQKSLKNLKWADGRKPPKLQINDERNFTIVLFKSWWKINTLCFLLKKGETIARVVERSNCTLTDRLYRYFTKSNNFQYLNILQTLVDGYNPSYHRSIGMKPSEVNTETSEQVWNTLYTKGL